MEHLQVWWGNVHIARGYLSLQRISPCHLFQYRLHVTLIFFSCEPGTNLRPPVLSYCGNTWFRSLLRCRMIGWRPGKARVHAQLDLSARGCVCEEMLQLAGRVGCD